MERSLRILSADESDSDVTVVFCDDHQEAPCNQLLRRRSQCHHGKPSGHSESPEEEEVLFLAKDWNPNLPLRNLPITMQEKRDTRDRRQMQRRIVGCWESWMRSRHIMGRRLLEQAGQVLSALQPWRRSLHSIEGRFGIGVKSYFVFLRYLVYLNLFNCLVTAAIIQTPVFIFGGNDTMLDSLKSNISVLDFFQGTGIMENSPVFYSFYRFDLLHGVCLNVPMLFLLGVSSVLLFSLLVIVRRTVSGYKYKWMLGARYTFNMSYKVFCGWDFCIQDPESAAFKQSFISNDFKMDLEEERFQQRVSQRTIRQKAWLYFLRFLLNFIVLVLLGSSFYLIHKATIYSQDSMGKEATQKNFFIHFLVPYLPPITITVVNFILPQLFRVIAKFEDYSLTVQVNVTLVRSIFLKLACLGIFLFFLYKSLTTKQKQCWENLFGQEMYKLVVFDLLACFTITFFVTFPKTLLREKYPQSILAKLMGKQTFMIPFNVLDLVYTQTVAFVGLFYCPLLPLICFIKFFVVFYIKKFSVQRCCDRAQRMFRASTSSVLFHFVLLLGLLMAIIVLGITLNKLPPSPTCGPFVGRNTVFNVTAMCVKNFPGPVHDFIQFLSSEAFVLPLILAEILFLTSSVSRRSDNNKSIERLKGMLVTCSSDKLFLVNKLSELLQSHSRILENSKSGGSQQNTEASASHMTETHISSSE